MAELQGLLGRAEEGLNVQGVVGTEVEMIKQQLQDFKVGTDFESEGLQGGGVRSSAGSELQSSSECFALNRIDSNRKALMLLLLWVMNAPCVFLPSCLLTSFKMIINESHISLKPQTAESCCFPLEASLQ